MAAVVIVLTASIFMPAQGRPSLFVPLHSQTLAQSIAWARQHDARLIGQGPFPGSIVITTKTPNLVIDALADGALLMAADASTCSGPVA